MTGLESKILFSVISAIIGSGLGFLAKSYFTRLSFRNSTVESIVKRYLDARDELCALVALCAIDVDAQDEHWLRDTRVSLSRLYYKYFDYIPREIIQELVCLQACLRDTENRLFKVEENSLLIVEAHEIEAFCTRISSLDNLMHGLYFSLTYGKEMDKRSRRVECQARHALMGINQYFTEANLTSLDLFKPKSKK